MPAPAARVARITRALARIKAGLQDKLYIGNLNSLRDWGHARDYVEAMWLILQQDEPDDYVIATGEQYSVRQFIEFGAEELGIELRWEGEGVDEKGINVATGDVIVQVDPRYFRPTEVDTLLGDPTKAKQKLNWEPKCSVRQLVAEMVASDYDQASRDLVVREAGFKTFDHHE